MKKKMTNDERMTLVLFLTCRNHLIGQCPPDIIDETAYRMMQKMADTIDVEKAKILYEKGKKEFESFRERKR